VATAERRGDDVARSKGRGRAPPGSEPELAIAGRRAGRGGGAFWRWRRRRALERISEGDEARFFFPRTASRPLPDNYNRSGLKPPGRARCLTS